MVPHVATRKTHQRFQEFSFDTPKRLLQQYLPIADVTEALLTHATIWFNSGASVVQMARNNRRAAASRREFVSVAPSHRMTERGQSNNVAMEGAGVAWQAHIVPGRNVVMS